MKGTLFCFLFVMQKLSWVSVSATSRGLATINAISAHQFGNSGLSPNSMSSPFILSSKEDNITKNENIVEDDVSVDTESKYRKTSRMGSTPPSCEHKCYGCNPCEAIQIPTTSSKHVHLGLHYSNYEPEGWKCKCGPFFYTP